MKKTSKEVKNDFSMHRFLGRAINSDQMVCTGSSGGARVQLWTLSVRLCWRRRWASDPRGWFTVCQQEWISSTPPNTLWIYHSSGVASVRQPVSPKRSRYSSVSASRALKTKACWEPRGKYGAISTSCGENVKHFSSSVEVTLAVVVLLWEKMFLFHIFPSKCS